MDLVSRRVQDRISAIEPAGSATEIALRYLEEVIPLDSDRQAEFDIWLSFVAQAQAESGAGGLREHLGPIQEGLRGLCRSLLESLGNAGGLRAGLDLDLETERLHALVDGLSLHTSMQPSRTTPARVREILTDHLNTLQP